MIDRDTVIALAAKHATCTSSQHKEFLHDDLLAFVSEISHMAAEAERDRICAAIEAEDDYCVDEGDYMLDSNDCIKVARGEWERPDYSVEARGTGGEG